MRGVSLASSTAALHRDVAEQRGRRDALEAIKLALQAILRNALRSFLTMLGIVIGVGAVIAMVTIGNGTTAKVAADLAKLGSNLLSVSPGQFGPGRASAEAKPFNIRDVEALKAQLRGVRAVAPTSQKSVNGCLWLGKPQHARDWHRERLSSSRTTGS